MTIEQVIRAAIPEAGTDLCDFILWNRTAYPCALTVRQLYLAAARHRRAELNNIELCDHCDNRREVGTFCCLACNKTLGRA